MVAVPVAIAAIVGAVLLIVSLTRESPAAFAKRHVQALFVSSAQERTATVHACQRVGTGTAPSTGVWACTVSGRGCTRVFRFAVDREYGTEPYDSPASAAVNTGPCRQR